MSSKQARPANSMKFILLRNCQFLAFAFQENHDNVTQNAVARPRTQASQRVPDMWTRSYNALIKSVVWYLTSQESRKSQDSF